MQTGLIKALDRFELVFSNLSLALLVVVLALQVIFRYVFQIGLTWSEEISRFAFVWFVYISASLAAQRGTHIRVTLFVNLIPGGRNIALLLADAIWIAFNLFVVAAGVMLLLFRPFRVGDFVEAGGTMGTVEEIDLFTTELKTPDNKMIIMPNGEMRPTLMRAQSPRSASIILRSTPRRCFWSWRICSGPRRRCCGS